MRSARVWALAGVVVCAAVAWGLGCYRICRYPAPNKIVRNDDLQLEALDDTIAYAPGDTLSLDVELTNNGSDTLVVWFNQSSFHLDQPPDTEFTYAPPPLFCSLRDSIYPSITLGPDNVTWATLRMTPCEEYWKVESFDKLVTVPSVVRLIYSVRLVSDTVSVLHTSESNEILVVPREEEQ